MRGTADLERLTPEHCDLMTEDHDLRVLGHLAPAEQYLPAKDPDRDQVEQTKSHEPRSWRNLLLRPNRRSQHLRRVLKRYKGREHARRIESRQAHPIHRAIRGYERRRLQLPD